MKKFENIDWVKVASISGAILSAASAVLANYANDKKLEQEVHEKVTKAIEENLKKRG